MPLAVGDIVQLTDVQSYLGQAVLNVFFYEMEEVGADVTLEDIGNVFQTLVIGDMIPLQAAALTHTRVILRNLTNGIDIFEEPIAIVGERGGTEGLASFYALSYRLVRTTGVTRHGSKRIGGVTENMVIGNDLAEAVVADANTLATKLALALTVDSGGDEDFIANPVIVGRVPQGSPGAGELDLAVINPVASAQFIRLSTQTTRRAGRGT